MTPSPEALGPIEAFVRGRLAKSDKPLIIGLCGAQGSGKSTIAAALAERIPDTVVLSLDDLYLSKARRQCLQHRLLKATRGVPGTHDITLGKAVLDAFRGGWLKSLPRFDKAIDDRVPETEEPDVEGARLMIFEGWCVGAKPQAPADLVEPVNALEAYEDIDGSWRRWVDYMLECVYQDLFDLDALVLLAAPSFDVVYKWRLQQEHALAADIAAGRRTGRAMSDDEIGRFIQFYQRLTEHILHEMPDRADLLIRLDADRRVIA